MKTHRIGTLALAALVSLSSLALAQDRLKSMPGYERYQAAGKKVSGAWKSGALSV